MSLSNLYSSENPTVISQLSRIRAEADHMKKMGVPEAQIAQHLQGRYTGTDIPAEALYAMLKNLQPPAPKPNGDTIAVQAAKLVLQKAQQEQQPDINVQQLQGALQPPPPPQQQGAPQQGDPQYGQGSIPMQQSAQPGPAVQPMRKGGLADLPKPNVGSEKNFAKGGIVAFAKGDLIESAPVPYEKSVAGRVGSTLGSIGNWFADFADPNTYNPEVGLEARAEDVANRNTFADLFGGPTYGLDLPKSSTVKPTVLADAEKGSPGSTWGGPPGRRRLPSAPQAAEPESNPPAAPAGLAALETEPSNVRDAFIKRAQQAPPTTQETINTAKEFSNAFDVEAGATSAQNRYGELAKKLEQARDQVIKDSRAIAQYKGAKVGGEEGAIMGFLANRAAAAEARSNANKDYIAGITGLTRGQVELDIHRTERAAKLRDTALAMQQRGNEQAAELFAKAAELYQRGEEAAAQRMENAAYRQAGLQQKYELADQASRDRRDRLLANRDYADLLGRYARARDGDPAKGVKPDTARATRLRQQLLAYGEDPDTIMSGGSSTPGFSGRQK